MAEHRTLEVARAAYARREWIVARDGFRAAQAAGELGPDDLYAAANCAWWLGELDRALPAMEAAHRGYLAAQRPARAAMVALDISYTLALRGEPARSSGWYARGVRLLEGLPEGVEHGYLRYIGFETAFGQRDLDGASRAAQAVTELGDRCGDATLLALGVLARGRIAVRHGQVARGLALLDDAMLAAVSEELDPSWAGNIYCHLMQTCFDIGDLERAAEWTEATTRWCERMPGAGPFLGICRVHRAQLLQVRGAWKQAEAELEHVRRALANFDLEVVAEACYQHGEVHRLRGELADAEQAYRAANDLGRHPQPGLALLALARRRRAAASRSIRSALDAVGEAALARAALLPAAVEIAVATGDLRGATGAASELDDLASTYRTARFAAEAATARGRVALAAGELDRAVPVLRAALAAWQRLPAPFEVARVRTLLAAAYGRVGDDDAAELERASADAALTGLGAPTIEVVSTGPPGRSDGLTAREAEVLGLVARGWSNARIAGELVLSVRTVERHLATVYQKLGIGGRSARAAAVSHALREGLIPRAGTSTTDRAGR